jgi:hypothetical protein
MLGELGEWRVEPDVSGIGILKVCVCVVVVGVGFGFEPDVHVYFTHVLF